MRKNLIYLMTFIAIALCSCEQPQLTDNQKRGILVVDFNGGIYDGQDKLISMGRSYLENAYSYFEELLNDPYREDYIFKGWSMIEFSSVASYTSLYDIITYQLVDTVYAVWEEISKPKIAKVRFKKVLDYTYVTWMGIYSLPMNYTTTKQLESYYFGTYAGTSDYYEIEAGRWFPAYYYTEFSGEWRTMNEPYNFEENQKYTFVTSDDGQYLTFYVTKDGAWNAPERLPMKVDTVQVIRTQIPVK